MEPNHNIGRDSAFIKFPNLFEEKKSELKRKQGACEFYTAIISRQSYLEEHRLVWWATAVWDITYHPAFRVLFCFLYFGWGVGGGDVSLFIVGNSEITEQSSSAINKLSIYKIYRGNITSIYW